MQAGAIVMVLFFDGHPIQKRLQASNRINAK
jgi:prepilin-type processing-associated H-X9-DG protein